MRQVQDFSSEVRFCEFDLIGQYLSQEIMWKIEMAFSQDHPEYFWTTQYLSISRENDVTSIVYQDIDRDVLESTFGELNDVANNIIAAIPSGASEYEKARYIYDYILDTVAFDYNAQYGQDIRGVFLENEAVCNSYAYAFKFLCDKVGVKCVIVTGYSDNGSGKTNHAWNAIQISGNWYWIDTTWGDTTGAADYYFCMTDKEIFRTHELFEQACDIALESSLSFKLPSCSSSAF